MKLDASLRWCVASLLLSVCPLLLRGADLKAIPLPAPKPVGGKPLMEALSERHTGREFKADPLDDQTLANLLWAGFGINRPATGQRTAPSAMNSQEIDVYVAMAQGLFIYEPKAHRLDPVLGTDLRARAGGQDTFRVAPITLIFVADLPRLAKAKPETRSFYAPSMPGALVRTFTSSARQKGLRL